MRNLSISCLIAGWLLASSSQAGVILSIDLDPSVSGVQSAGNFAVGQTVNADVVLSLDAAPPTSLSTYQFSIQYDRTELEFVSRSESVIPGFGFVETDTSNVNNTSLGELYLFGADTGVGPTAPSGQFVVASLVFNAIAPSGAAGDIDIRAARLTSQGDDFLVNGTFAVIPVSQLTFNSASVSGIAVP
jgi:hypothetical protein